MTPTSTVLEVNYILQRNIRALEELDEAGRGPLELCSTFGRPELLELLLTFEPSKAEVICRGEIILFGACAEGHLKAVQLLTEKYGALMKKLPAGEAPIGVAARYGHLDVVKYLNSMGEGEPSENGDYSPRDSRWIFQMSNFLWMWKFGFSSPKRTLALATHHYEEIQHMIFDIAIENVLIFQWFVTDENIVAHFDTPAFAREHAHRLVITAINRGYPRLLDSLVDDCKVDLSQVHLQQSGSLLTYALTLWLRNPEDPEGSRRGIFLSVMQHGFSLNIQFECPGITADTTIKAVRESSETIDKPYMGTHLILAARHGNLEVVKLLVELGASDLDTGSPGGPGGSAFYQSIVAVEEHGEETALWILNYMDAHGTLFKVATNEILAVCVFRGAYQVALALLRKFPKFGEIRIGKGDFSILDTVLLQDEVDLAKSMLSDPNLSITWRTHLSKATFAHCVAKQQLNSARFILASRHEISWRLAIDVPDDGSVPHGIMTRALLLPELDIAKTLIQEVEGAKLPKPSHDPSNPFNIAIFTARADIIDLYASHKEEGYGMELNAVGDTWFHCICMQGRRTSSEQKAAVLRRLFDMVGPEIAELSNVDGDTPMLSAITVDDPLIIKTLLDAGVSIHSGESEAYFDFISKISANFRPLPDELALPPIHMAIVNRSLTFLRAVFERFGTSAFRPEYLILATWIPALGVSQFFIETIFPSYLPFGPPGASISDFDEETVQKVRNLYYVATNARNWVLIHHLAITRNLHCLAPEYFFPDVRSAFTGPIGHWEELYDVQIVGRCMNISVEQIRSLRANDPHTTVMVAIADSTVITCCIDANLPLLKAMYKRGADLNRTIGPQLGKLIVFAGGSFNGLNLVKWLLSKGCTLFVDTGLGRGLPDLQGLGIHINLLGPLKQLIDV